MRVSSTRHISTSTSSSHPGGVWGFRTGIAAEKGKKNFTVEMVVGVFSRAASRCCSSRAYKADNAANLVYHRLSTNFNPIMATAADITIVEVEHIVEVGEIDPDEVMTPGILVD